MLQTDTAICDKSKVWFGAKFFSKRHFLFDVQLNPRSIKTWGFQNSRNCSKTYIFNMKK